MMGRQSGQVSMVILDIAELIPRDHLLRKINQMVSFDFIYALVAPYIVSNLTASCFCNEHVFVLITIDKKSEIFSCFK